MVDQNGDIFLVIVFEVGGSIWCVRGVTGQLNRASSKVMTNISGILWTVISDTTPALGPLVQLWRSLWKAQCFGDALGALGEYSHFCFLGVGSCFLVCSSLVFLFAASPFDGIKYSDKPYTQDIKHLFS